MEILRINYPFTFWGPWVRLVCFIVPFQGISKESWVQRVWGDSVFFQTLSIFKGAIAWKTFAHGRRNKRLQSRKLTLEKCFYSTSAGKEANECLDKCSQLIRSAKKWNTGTLRHSISHISERVVGRESDMGQRIILLLRGCSFIAQLWFMWSQQVKNGLYFCNSTSIWVKQDVQCLKSRAGLDFIYW